MILKYLLMMNQKSLKLVAIDGVSGPLCKAEDMVRGLWLLTASPILLQAVAIEAAGQSFDVTVRVQIEGVVALGATLGVAGTATEEASGSAGAGVVAGGVGAA